MFVVSIPVFLRSIVLGSLAFLLLSCNSNGITGKLDFYLEDINQQMLRLSDYRGQWVVVNYWATWCPPCREEIPDLVRLHTENDTVTVIGISEELLDPAKLKAFIKTYAMPYPIIPNFIGRQDKQAQIDLKAHFPLRGLPTTYVVNPEGKLARKIVGPVNFDTLMGIIKPKD
jgi:peroxiredoxin